MTTRGSTVDNNEQGTDQRTRRHCPTCLTPLPAGTRRRYCTPACKTEGWRRNHAADTDRQPTPRKTPASPPPTTIRDCPHCGTPIAVVTLLASPNVAQVDTPHNIR
jgi:endogenous inhibitor of DNA gyrase (YacG/DUF329 family)